MTLGFAASHHVCSLTPLYSLLPCLILLSPFPATQPANPQQYFILLSFPSPGPLVSTFCDYMDYSLLLNLTANFYK